MQHGREGDHQRDVLQRNCVAVLRLAQVHDRVGQRTVVSNTPREHIVHAVADALEHDPGPQHSLIDRGLQAAGSADRVDRAHVMTVSTLDRSAGLEVDAQ